MRTLRRQAFVQQCLLFVMSCQWIAAIGEGLISATEPPLQQGDSLQTAVDETSRSGYLGIDPIDVGTAAANALGVKSPNGTVVRNVVPKSPADVTGLKAGDVILSLGGHETGDLAAFQMAMTRSMPGQEVVLDVRRVDSLMNFKVRLSRMPVSYTHLTLPTSP
jgi:S1-C subfamily serine protease